MWSNYYSFIGLIVLAGIKLVGEQPGQIENNLQVHCLENKLHVFEKQVEESCGLSCTAALKQNTWVENVGEFFNTSYDLAKLFITVGLVLTMYQLVVIRLDENVARAQLGRAAVSILSQDNMQDNIRAGTEILTAPLAQISQEQATVQLDSFLKDERTVQSLGQVLFDLLKLSGVPSTIAQILTTTNEVHALERVLVTVLSNSNARLLIGQTILNLLPTRALSNPRLSAAIGGTIISKLLESTALAQLVQVVTSLFHPNRHTRLLSKAQALGLIALGFLGYSARDLINKPSPLCVLACRSIKEQEELLDQAKVVT